MYGGERRFEGARAERLSARRQEHSPRMRRQGAQVELAANRRETGDATSDAARESLDAALPREIERDWPVVEVERDE